MLLALLMLGGGLVLLAVAGDWLIDGAARLALLANLSPTVVGLTVVAMGTSMPELAVSLDAAIEGSPDISYANIVGSNVFNIGAILGLAALIRPFGVRSQTLRLEYPFMVLVLWIGLLLSRDGYVDRLEAAFFLFVLAAFVVFIVRLSRSDPPDEETRKAAQTLRQASREGEGAGRLWLPNIGLVAVGIVGLAGGAELIVRGAVRLAIEYGIAERVIGLTIIAMGTSLPELGATIAAARRGQPELAFGNIVGSNIFNVLCILGLTAAIIPIPVNADAVRVDNWVMLGFAVGLFAMLWRGRNVSRLNGLVLLVGFVAYMSWVVLAG